MLGETLDALERRGFVWKLRQAGITPVVEAKTSERGGAGMVDVGGSLEETIVGWQDALARFRAIRSRYLVYRGR